MATKKKAAPVAPRVTNSTFSNISVTNTSAPTNEHTATSVIALANAISRNADAIIAVAAALKGAPVSLGTAIKIGCDDNG